MQLREKSNQGSFSALSPTFFRSLLIIPAFLFVFAIPIHGQSFDFSLSAVGPHNVVRGRDLYIRISSQTISGSGGNTTLSVQNKPTGVSSFWPDLKKTCCGDGNDGTSYYYASATFSTALRLTTATTTPTGNYTIFVTAVNNGITRQLPYTFSVLAPPSPTVPPAIGNMPAIPNLSNWQSNMTTYGQQVCNYLDTPGLTFNQKFPWIYYDQTRVMYQISDYTGSPSYWNACALKARTVYRDEYVIPEGGNVPGHYVFTTGLRMDYERTGDTQSKNAALLLAQDAAFVEDSTLWTQLIDNSVSRETAYAILAKLDAEKLGEPTSERLVSLVDVALGHMDQWFVSKTYRCPVATACDPEAAVGQYYIQPFMVGLTMRALIVYYEKTGDPRIPPAIKTAADWLWANAWVASSQAFWYQNHVSDPSLPFPAQPGADDLNLLIAPAYAWLYLQTGDATYQTRGDQIFSGGVMGPMSGGNLNNGKQFDQNYLWSFDYVKWRTVSVSNQPDLVVTAVTWSPASPATGNAVTFSATIKNQGTSATPAGVVHRVEFKVGGVLVNWSDTSTTSLAAGASRTVTANSGPTGGSSTWTATSGTHTVLATVDTPNQFAESNESNNTFTSSMTVAGGSGSQLLLNPGFESGNVNWVGTSGVITNLTNRTPRTGSWYAWLNGYSVAHTDSLYQQITIPSGTTSATLSFYLKIDTAETTTTTAYDTLQVQIRNSSNTVLATLATYSNLNATTGYILKTFDLAAYQGQTIRVYFLGTEDEGLQTSFLIDDTALTVSTGSSSQLLLNPGFESGNVNWVATSGVITNLTNRTPRTGSWYAWLNGYSVAHTDSLYQQITIPSGTTSATLSFYLKIDTAETTTTTAYDTLQVQIRNSSNTVLATLATYSNLNATTGYILKTFDLAAYQGQTIRVYFLGTEDEGLQTSFLIDDTAVNITQ